MTDLTRVTPAYKSLVQEMGTDCPHHGVVGKFRGLSGPFVIWDNAGRKAVLVNKGGNDYDPFVTVPDVVPPDKEELEAVVVRCMAHFARHGGDIPSRVIGCEMPDVGLTYRPAEPVEREFFVFPFVDSVFGISKQHL